MLIILSQYLISIALIITLIISIKYMYKRYVYLMLDEFVFKCYYTDINNEHTYKYINQICLLV